MISRYYKALVVLSLIIAGAVVSLDARRRVYSNARCKTEESCKENKNCQCYCSGIGAFRNKTENDNPIFVPNDPNKVYCYCKKWDLEAFPKGERPADMKQ